MSKDPERCCIQRPDGTRCVNKPFYKVGPRGFCEEHKHHASATSKKTAGTPTRLLDKSSLPELEPMDPNRPPAWPYFRAGGY